ncbi:hypothetical protein BSL82_01140 [Tardibacter chloracetimidivorans]|uniref:Uncharacterized protein n=1 Tax=Tardibacter chloracetimidivorans TaxID=1921510 RepID=A0A1L3ZR32_9SPHN|nr:hypothetical protein BSL82_01140 [Tardibacter chloracetimidivorans]
MKFCKDCKHAAPDRFYNTPFLRRTTKDSWRFARCFHPSLVFKETNLVSGEIAVDYDTCSSKRRSGCGEDAKYFEPRE